MLDFHSKFTVGARLMTSRSKKRAFIVFMAVCGFILFLASPITGASAQSTDFYWSEPYRLSSPTGQAGMQMMIADPFGYVHLFWPETGLLENQTILYYSRFDGVTWTMPVDILIAPAATEISGTLDNKGTLHLMFTDTTEGAVYYTAAHLQDATSAQGWQAPQQLEFRAQAIALQVDSMDVLHVLYSGYTRNEAGIYYTQSVDEGQTWSRPIWLDPGSPPDLAPSQIQLELGEEASLHASWFYWDQNFLGRWIRYANSFDQGESWSAPFTIDEVEAGSEELRLPRPSMTVSGKEVHIIWAGDVTTHRKHRFSHDSGRTWHQATFVFGDLHGSALGDGLALDVSGRLHFFAQIRWPQGIYHSYWYQGRWSSPSMIYLIAQDAFEPLGERIHAHRVRAAVRAGNQLVVTFTTSPGDSQSILYAMHRRLSDISDSGNLPFPPHLLLPKSDSELASPTQLPEIPAEVPDLNSVLDPGAPRANTSSGGLIWNVLLVVLLVAGIVTFRYLSRRNN